MSIFDKPKGKTPHKIFHGGCHGCEVQHNSGTLNCTTCCFHKADWNKQSLNTLEKKERTWKNIIKFFASFRLIPRNKKIVFHGGCLDCSSQKKHGVRRCLGCQYFEANWSKPNLSIKN